MPFRYDYFVHPGTPLRYILIGIKVFENARIIAKEEYEMVDYISEYDIVIDKPIEFVFDNMTCQKGCINWATGMRSAEKLGDEPLHVGSQYRHEFTFMGMNASAVSTVTERNRPYEFGTADDTSKVIQWESRFTYKETPECGTHVHVTQHHHAGDNLMGRVATSMFIRRYRKQFQTDLETLKEMLEDGMVIQHP
jgi:hypothetical protein